MIKLQNIPESELATISAQIADAFYDYIYNEADEGLVRYISDRNAMHVYISAIVKAAYKSGMLYTTSERHEGFLILSGEGVGTIRFFQGLKMIAAEKKALGGFRKMKEFISACFSEGNTIETRMKKAKRKFIRIELLAVRPEYQGQGYMRKLMEYVYRLADDTAVAVILDTDDMDKSLRYQHLGMKLDRIRNCGEKFHMYDLIRPEKTE